MGDYVHTQKWHSAGAVVDNTVYVQVPFFVLNLRALEGCMGHAPCQVQLRLVAWACLAASVMFLFGRNKIDTDLVPIRSIISRQSEAIHQID